MESNITPFNKPAVNARLRAVLEEIEERIKIDGTNRGKENLPPCHNKKLHSYFREWHLAYQALIHEIGRDLLFKSSVDEVIEHKALTDTRLREADNALFEVQQQRIPITAALKGRRSPYSILRIYLVWISMAVVTLMDGLLSMPIWQTFGYNLLTSRCLGVLFAAALALTAHYFNMLVMLGKTRLQRRIIIASLLTMLTALFYFMAEHRSEYNEIQMAQNGLKPIHTNPLTFVLPSILFFLVAVAIKLFSFPNEEQREQLYQYQQLLKEREQNEALQQKLLADKIAIHKEHADLRKANIDKIEFGSTCESIIMSAAEKGLEVWKKYNLNHRTDKCRPLSFDEPYPFNFETNFNKIKQL